MPDSPIAAAVREERAATENVTSLERMLTRARNLAASAPPHELAAAQRLVRQREAELSDARAQLDRARAKLRRLRRGQ